MLVAQVLGCVLVLGWGSGLEGLPVLPEPVFTTQENFNLSSFLGEWHDVALVSSCPHEGHNRRDAAIGSLELKEGLEAGMIQAKKTMLTREGVCKEISTDYELTTTPGRFYYNIKRWQAEVDAYVVHTNYQEYAIVITSKQKSSGKPSISLKLFSRTMEVRDTVLADFKTLAKDLGMSNNSIIMKQDKGRCVPGEEALEETVPEEFQVVQRKRRDVSPSAAPVEEDGSGMDMSDFVDPAACSVEPDSGPCFGMMQRFFYNSSSTSCEEFQYGGCLGNQNNFVAERECLQRCRTEAVCRLPMAASNCTGQPAVWVFDATSGMCLGYKPGYCQDNGNKFYSKAECEEYCGAAKEEED